MPVFSRRSCAAGAVSLAMWLVIQTPASALTPYAPPSSFYQNPISMQAQEKTPWCWYHAQVMPRGDGGPAPDAQDTGFVPLLIFGGLLLIGVGGFFLRSKKREHQRTGGPDVS